MGTSIRMDDNGDSEGSYTVLAARFSSTWQSINISKSSKASVNFRCRFEMVPVGRFDTINNKTDDAESPAKFNLTGKILWVQGRVPRDEPTCGYRNDKCPPIVHYDREGGAFISSVIFGLFLIIAAIAAFLSYLNWKKEQEIRGPAWKIDPKDLIFAVKSKVLAIHMFSHILKNRKN